ncbi:hypothetical protein ACP275_14G228900 [Erythranthe tilingii]
MVFFHVSGRSIRRDRGLIDRLAMPIGRPPEQISLYTLIDDQTDQIIGYKKILVYYEGDHKSSRKTDWIMYEYTVPVAEPFPCKKRLPNENNVRLDGWVICRIHEWVRKAKKAKLDDNSNLPTICRLLLCNHNKWMISFNNNNNIQDAIQEVGGNNCFSVEEFAQALLQQQQMDYQQQEQRQQQYIILFN